MQGSDGFAFSPHVQIGSRILEVSAFAENICKYTYIYIYLSLNYIDGLTKTQIEHGGRKNRVNTTHDRFGSIEHPGCLALHGLSNSLV